MYLTPLLVFLLPCWRTFGSSCFPPAVLMYVSRPLNTGCINLLWDSAINWDVFLSLISWRGSCASGRCLFWRGEENAASFGNPVNRAHNLNQLSPISEWKTMEKTDWEENVFKVVNNVQKTSEQTQKGNLENVTRQWRGKRQSTNRESPHTHWPVVSCVGSSSC